MQDPPLVESKRHKKHKKKRHRKRKHESESSAVESERENRNPQVQPQPYTPISHECTVNYDYDPSSLHTMKGSRAFRLPASSIAPSQAQSQAPYLAPSQAATSKVTSQTASQIVSMAPSEQKSSRNKRRENKQKEVFDYIPDNRRDEIKRQPEPQQHKKRHSSHYEVLPEQSPLLDVRRATQQHEKLLDEKVQTLKKVKESLTDLSRQASNMVFAQTQHSQAHQSQAQHSQAHQSQTHQSQAETESAQRYLKWLERNPPQRVRSSSRTDESGDNKKKKSVENVKEYCIQKLLGKLDTKSELKIVARHSIEEERRAQEEKYRSKYAKAQEELAERRKMSRNLDSEYSKPQSAKPSASDYPKNSDVYVNTTMQNTQHSSFSKPPIHDSQKQSQNYQEDPKRGQRNNRQFSFNKPLEAEDQKKDNYSHEVQVSGNASSQIPMQNSSSYYTLGREQQDTTFEQYRASQERTSYERASQQYLEHVTSSQSTMQRTQQESRDIATDSRFKEESFYPEESHYTSETLLRIEQLRQQAAQIQRIPKDINERVSKIKERTAQITQQAAQIAYKSRSRSRDFQQQNYQRQSVDDDGHDLEYHREMQWHHKQQEMHDLSQFKPSETESRNQVSQNLSGMLNHQIEINQLQSDDVLEESQPIYERNEVSESVLTTETKLDRHERRRLRKERKRLLRKIKERGVVIPPEVEAMVANMENGTQSEIASSRLRLPNSQMQSMEIMGNMQNNKFSSTRKQLMYLMAIQNEHSRLLEDIQRGGYDSSQREQLNLTSAHLMTQIQAIFEHLQDIQQKLDREKMQQTEREEEPIINQSRNVQDKSVQLSNQSSSIHVQLMPHFPYPQSTQPQRTQKVTEKKDNKNSKHNSMKGIFQDRFEGHKQLIKNAYSKQNGIQVYSYEPSELHQSAHDDQYGLREHTDQTMSRADLKQKPIHSFKNSLDIRTQESETDYGDYPTAHFKHSSQAVPMNPFLTNQTTGSQGSDARMTEVFCSMLSAEIEKIKAESVSQVNAMREHYAYELQALREEFFAKEQELNRRRIVTEYQDQPRNLSASVQIGQVGSPVKNSVIEELRKVKAERDNYYQKLVTVKEKLQLSSQTRERLNNFGSVQTTSGRAEPDQSTSWRMPAPRHRPEDSQAMQSFAANSIESFSQPAISGKQNFFDEKPTDIYLQKEHSFNQMASMSQDQHYSQSFPHSQREGYVASPDVLTLKQQTEPEDTQRMDEDDGGSVEKSFSNDVYLEQVSQRSRQVRRTKRSSSRQNEKHMKSMSSSSNRSRSKSVNQRKQEAIATVMSNGLPCTVLDQHAYGLRGKKLENQSLRRSRHGHQWRCDTCKMSPSDSDVPRSRSRSPTPGMAGDTCVACGKPPTPTAASGRLDYLVNSAKRAQSPIMVDFQPIKKADHQRVVTDFANNNSRGGSSMRKSEGLNETQKNRTSRVTQNASSDQMLSKQFHQSGPRIDTREANFNMTLMSANMMNVTDTLGNTMSTQNLALTLKEKEIEERISRIESFLRTQV